MLEKAGRELILEVLYWGKKLAEGQQASGASQTTIHLSAEDQPEDHQCGLSMAIQDGRFHAEAAAGSRRFGLQVIQETSSTQNNTWHKRVLP